MTVYFQIVVLFFNLIWMAQAQDIIFKVRATRNQADPNILTMYCNGPATVTSDSLFFLNGSNLEDIGNLIVVRSRNPNPESITFRLRRDLEGNYTCRPINNANVKIVPVQFVGEFCMFVKFYSLNRLNYLLNIFRIRFIRL